MCVLCLSLPTADFGDFNRYDSQDFLQKFALFPIDWIQDERVLEEATQKVAIVYQSFRWHEINNMSHNRSFFGLELSNREESVQFQTVSLSLLSPSEECAPLPPEGSQKSLLTLSFPRFPMLSRTSLPSDK
ncbi:hypothetical protein GOODEAATRI_019556, partial [Goodea atripinnis]